MNISVLLVGFNYRTASSNIKSIPGVLIDLFCMANYWSKKNVSYFVLTDYQEDETLETLIPSMVDGVVTPDIQTWIRTIKQQQLYTYASSSIEVLEWLGTLPIKSNHVVLYFTGHGKHGGWICPDGNILYTDQLMKTLIHERNTMSEIVYIMDCCETDADIFWPYEISDTQRHWIRHHKHDLSFIHNIIILTPKEPKPISSLKGSFFTLKLLAWWETRVTSWLAYTTFCQIKATWPSGRTIPYWLLYPGSSVQIYPLFLTYELSS